MNEAFRHECEVRYAEALPEIDRKDYYAMVLKRRGQEAANKLIHSVNALRRQIRGAQLSGEQNA